MWRNFSHGVNFFPILPNFLRQLLLLLLSLLISCQRDAQRIGNVSAAAPGYFGMAPGCQARVLAGNCYWSWGKSSVSLSKETWRKSMTLAFENISRGNLILFKNFQSVVELKGGYFLKITKRNILISISISYLYIRKRLLLNNFSIYFALFCIYRETF